MTADGYKAEVKLDFTAADGLQTVRLFLGDYVDGAKPTETLTGALTGHVTDYLEDGILTNPNVKLDLRVDEAVNATNWIGPA